MATKERGYKVKDPWGRQLESQDLAGKSDLTNPGWAESFWQQNGDDFAGQDWGADAMGQYGSMFSEPTAIEQYWGQVSGQPARNRSAEQYDNGPQFGAYYDQAYTRGANKINDQLAARGMYGSSQGGQMLSDFGSSLEAQRANRESDFMAGLAQQADQTDLAQQMGRGSLASQASGAGLNRAAGGIQAGLGLDNNERSDFSTGMAGATNAQTMREGRIRGSYEDLLKESAMTSGITGQAYGDMFSSDSQQFENFLSMALGIPREQLNQTLADEQARREMVAMLIQGFGGAASMAKGF